MNRIPKSTVLRALLTASALSLCLPWTTPAAAQQKFVTIGTGGVTGRVLRRGRRDTAAVPVISKKGKADLRYALYQAALVASSLSRHFRPYYNRLLEGRQREKGIRTKMRVKIAAKMLVIAWTLMKRKEFFNPAHIQA